MTGSNGGVNARDLVWPIVIMFVALVAGVVALAIFLPESRDVTVIVTPLVATFSTLALMIGGWVTLRRMSEKVDQVEEVVNATAADTAEIREQTNGKLQATVRQTAYDSTIRALQDRLGDDATTRGDSE